jgi:hypothetical protein
VHVVEVVRMARAEDREAERRCCGGNGYDFCDRRDICGGADERQDKREPELLDLEAEERLASIGDLRLRPAREEQTEDRDEQQDGGHGSQIGPTGLSLHPWSM